MDAYLKNWYFDPKHGPTLPSNWQLSTGNFPRMHALTDAERKQIEEYLQRSDVRSGWQYPYFRAALVQNLTPSTIDRSGFTITDRERADFADIQANWRRWITAPQTDIDPTIDMPAEYEKLGYGKKKKQEPTPAPEVPKKPKIRVIKKGTQAPDNQPPITQHRVTGDDYSAPIRDKYEGLADIVAEATGQTQATPEDIGAEIDPTTHRIVGGTNAWSSEFASDWDKKVNAALKGKSDWHKTESAAQQRARENKEAFEADILEDQARIDAEREARAAGKDYEDYVTQKTNGVIRDSASRSIARRNEKTRHELNLAEIAQRKEWRDMYRGVRSNTEQLAEAASVIAYSQRFRIANHLARFQTPQERNAYLDAFHITNPQMRRDILHAAELERLRRHPEEVVSSAIRDRWMNQGPRQIHGSYGSWSGRNQYDLRTDPISGVQYYNPNPDAPGQYYQVGNIRAIDRNIKQEYIDGRKKFGDTDPIAKKVKAEDVNRLPKEFTNNLSQAGDAVKQFGKVLEQVGHSIDQLWGATATQAQGIYDASSYFLPSPLKGAGQRLFTAHLQAGKAMVAPISADFSAAGQVLQGVGNGMKTGAAAGAMFGLPGMAIGGLLGAAPGLIKGWTTHRIGEITERGQLYQSQINLWAGAAELILAPFRILGSVINNTIGMFRKLSFSVLGLVSKFNQLGLPITMLTGVTYADMQRSYAEDSMIGASRGTTNGTYEGFAKAQMDLYTYGQMDERRLVSAAMLGVFNDVYAFGGDTQAQYAHMANSIYAQLQATNDPIKRQRLMNLANDIDPTLQKRLQQMENLGVSDYGFLQNGRWHESRGIRQYTATTQQRAAYTWAGMEYTALSESIGETKNVVAERLWRSIGKPLMSAVNDIFYDLANGGSWRNAWQAAKKAIKELWSNIAKEFGFSGDFRLQLGKWTDSIKEKIIGILPVLYKAVLNMGAIILDGWKEIIKATQPMINQLISTLAQISIQPYFDRETGQVRFQVWNDEERKRRWEEGVTLDWYGWKTDQSGVTSLPEASSHLNSLLASGFSGVERFLWEKYGGDLTSYDRDTFLQPARDTIAEALDDIGDPTAGSLSGYPEIRANIARELAKKYAGPTAQAMGQLGYKSLEKARKDPKFRGTSDRIRDPDNMDWRKEGYWTEDQGAMKSLIDTLGAESGALRRQAAAGMPDEIARGMVNSMFDSFGKLGKEATKIILEIVDDTGKVIGTAETDVTSNKAFIRTYDINQMEVMENWIKIKKGDVSA